MKQLGQFCYPLGWILVAIAVVLRLLTYSLSGVQIVQKIMIYPHTLLELGALAFLISIASSMKAQQS